MDTVNTRTSAFVLDLAFTFVGHAMLAGIGWIVVASFFATDTCPPLAALTLDCPVTP
jgi:hypothetical protein